MTKDADGIIAVENEAKVAASAADSVFIIVQR